MQGQTRRNPRRCPFDFVQLDRRDRQRSNPFKRSTQNQKNRCNFTPVFFVFLTDCCTGAGNFRFFQRKAGELQMQDVTMNTELVACCGLYCGACKSYLHSKCRGCRENAKAAWCKVRSCCLEQQITTCAECSAFPNTTACNRYNNFISRLFGWVFDSDRAACIAQIKRIGLGGHAKAMAETKARTIKRSSCACRVSR